MPARSSAQNTSAPAAVDAALVWHPFTRAHEWMGSVEENLVIVEGQGAMLTDSAGREYVDGNSSIWTNLHGHRKPELDAAIQSQLGKVAHTSFLGLTNDVAPFLAKELLQWFAGGPDAAPAAGRVFFSDDGSTAVEAGLKMIHQARAQRGEPERAMIFSLSSSYHGDTVGAMSLGHSPQFHHTFGGLMFPTHEVPSPHCYRCIYNKAAPRRGMDARDARQCNWECLQKLDKALADFGPQVSAMVMEPLVQGAGYMAMHPKGYLKQVEERCRKNGTWLFLDEVLTGFGRTGAMFAFQKEGVRPDVVALAKGLTGGYLPVAATVASDEIFSAFVGDDADPKVFFHGHSYTGNQLGCAAARANLQIFERENVLAKIGTLSTRLSRMVQRFWEHPNVGDIRCEGTICAIELVEDFATRRSFGAEQRIGHRVCMAARAHGLLTRPVGDVLVLMPPYCITDLQLAEAVEALWRGLVEILPPHLGPKPIRAPGKLSVT